MIPNFIAYPENKPSRQPWLGDIPVHWKMKRAKWLFRKMNRSVEETDDVITCFRDGIVTLRKNRRVRGFTESIKEIGYQGICKGDLVIHAMDAFAGAIGVSDSDGKGSPVYSVCKPNENVNPYYYAFIIREMARSQWILALAKGIRERSTDFRFQEFASQIVPYPPLEEQQAIVRFLNHADWRIQRFIRAKQKLIKLLNEQKQAIIHQAVTRGLDPNVRLKPSGVEGLGDIPEHWENPLNQRIFKEVIRPHNDREETQLSLSQRDGLIATNEMQERSLQTSTYENWKVTLPGDLVLNRFKAHLGVFFCSTLRGIVSFHYGVFSPRKNLITKYFELLFHTNPYKSIFAGRSNGMTVGLQNLSNQNFYNVRAIVPPFEEQEAIITFLTLATEEMNEVINATKQEITLLEEFRTRLISDVVTGKIDVHAAVAGLPEELGEGENLEVELSEVEIDIEEGLEEEA
ncbi:MAG: restriction endonuclease subunit S [Anaerolineaceae bacterium]